MVARDAAEFYDRTDDFAGPSVIEADGVDIGQDCHLMAIGKHERAGIERHVGAQAALMGLSSPAALGRARGGSDVGAPYASPQIAHLSSTVKE